jgi:anti-sigma factor RsiW
MPSDPTEPCATMDCGDLGRLLDAYLDGELAPSERVQAEAHVRDCATCRALVVREGHAHMTLRAQLRAAMGPGTTAGAAPEQLRERIHLALVERDPPAWRRWISPLRVAAIAACAAGALLVFALHGRPDSTLADEAIRTHVRDLPLEVTTASAGPESIAGWFTGKLDFNAAPPRFHGPVRIVGARLSHIGDRPAAYVRYEAPRGRFGLFIFDDPERRFEGSGRVIKVGPSTVRLANLRGFNVAVWRRNEIVYSLVSDLDEDDLARLVEAAQVTGPP